MEPSFLIYAYFPEDIKRAQKITQKEKEKKSKIKFKLFLLYFYLRTYCK